MFAQPTLSRSSGPPFAHPEPPYEAFRNPHAQRDLVTTVFAHAGWEVPGTRAALRDADGLFFDAVSQMQRRGLCVSPGLLSACQFATGSLLPVG